MRGGVAEIKLHCALRGAQTRGSHCALVGNDRRQRDMDGLVRRDRFGKHLVRQALVGYIHRRNLGGRDLAAERVGDTLQTSQIVLQTSQIVV